VTNVLKMPQPKARPKDMREQMGDPVGRLSFDEIKAAVSRTVDGEFSDFETLTSLVGSEKGSKLIIVGGGASLKDTLPSLKKRLKLSKKTKVLAVNKSHDWLLARGVRPHYAAMCDPGEWISKYLTPQNGVKYLLSSSLHEKTLRRFKPFNRSTYIWHGAAKYEEGKLFDWAEETYPGVPLPFLDGCGSTIGMAAIHLAAILGFKEVTLHGFDSCFLPGQDNLHAYTKPRPTPILGDVSVKSVSSGDVFRFATDPNMARQALEFGDLMLSLGTRSMLGKPWDMTIKVAGKGVIPWLTWKDGGFMCQHAEPWTMDEFEGISEVDYRPDWAKEQLEGLTTEGAHA
jgi:hypothetical protein